VLVALALGSLLGALPVLVSTGDEQSTVDPNLDPSFVIQLISTSDSVLCPEAALVAEALTARMPNIIAAGEITSRTAVLGLTLSQGGPTAVRLRLRDRNGAVVLERLLDTTAPGGGRPPGRVAADCAALADTVALIVERYLRQIGYRDVAPLPTERLGPPTDSAPPNDSVPITDTSAPPRAGNPALASVPVQGQVLRRAPVPVAPAGPTSRDFRSQVFLGAGFVLSAPVSGAGADSGWIRTIGLAADLHLGALALSASAGLGEPTEKAPVPLTDGGSFRILPMPIRVGVGLVVRAGPGSVVPAVGGGVDLLWPSTRRIDGEHPRAVVEPRVDGGAAYVLLLGRHAYLKIHAASVLNLQPHDFVLDGNSGQSIFRTARLYLRAGVDAGIALGRN
jgi:hypothetical protein